MHRLGYVRAVPILHSIFLELTYACNSKCMHCRVSTTERSGDELSTREWLTLIDQAYSMGTSYLTVTGGEPLLRDDVHDILRYSSGKGFRTLLATNGLLLSQHAVDLLEEMENVSVQISLDGASDAVHDSFRGIDGSFDKAIQAIERCVRANMDASVSMTLTRHNIADLPQMIALGHSLGVRTVKLRRFVASGQGFQNLTCLDLSATEMQRLVEFYLSQRASMEGKIALLMEQAPFQVVGRGGEDTREDAGSRIRGGCSAGNAICVVDPVGNVRPCPSLSVDVGNVRVTTLKTLWEFSPVLNSLRNRANLGGKCGECQYRSLCGGCRAEAYSRLGEYLGEDPKCCYTPTRNARPSLMEA